MLLKDIGIIEPRKKFNSLNKFLKENYGVSIRETDENSVLRAKESLTESLAALKRNNLNPKDSEFSKTVMMISAIDSLLEAIHHERPHNTYRKVVGHLYDTAVKLINVGDEVDEAVASVMKQYRSSPYRFSDAEVEFDLRKRIGEYMGSMEESITAGSIAGIAAPLTDDLDEEDQVFDLEPEEDEADDPGVELWFCGDCALGRVNDDFTAIDDEERYEEVSSCVHSLPPSVSAGDEIEEFSNTPCDCCGTMLAGQRHQFWDLGSDDQTDII